MTKASTVTATQQPRQPPRQSQKVLQTIALVTLACLLYNTFLEGNTNKIFLESILLEEATARLDCHIEQTSENSNPKSPMTSTETRHGATHTEGMTTTATTMEAPEIIHVIQSRFMQRQPNLVRLGLTRVKLFETFSLPTIRQQTNQNFLWIIWADPQLDNRVKEPMMALLRNQSNIILLAKNDHPRRAILSPGILTEEVWSGDKALLQRYHDAAQERRFVVETRLDADDGLPFNFIDTIQDSIHQDHMYQEESLDFYRFWCVRRHIEWHAINPFPDSPERSIKPYGYLVERSKAHTLCITPGLTMLYGKEVQLKDIPNPHLYAKNTSVCSENGAHVNCWSFSYDGPDAFAGTIRARTPTSAGMMDVKVVDEQGNGTATGQSISAPTSPLQDTDLEERRKWQSVLDEFGIHPDQMLATKEHFKLHLAEIAAENLQGQCIPGFTCKPSSKAALAKLKNIG